jgi:hypothetical protein
MNLTEEQQLITAIDFDYEGEGADEKKEEIKLEVKPQEETKKEEPKLVDAISFLDEPIDAAEKEYLMFYTYGDDKGNEVKDWELITGRKQLYEFIKGLIETLNLDESFILADKEILNNRLTVYEFMKYVVEEQKLYPDDNFNIDDYR